MTKNIVLLGLATVFHWAVLELTPLNETAMVLPVQTAQALTDLAGWVCSSKHKEKNSRTALWNTVP